MDLEILAFLLSPQGERLLETAKSMEGSLLTRLTRLRRDYPPQVVAAAVELLELREKAKAKFELAEKMFFTKEALEQSSSETVSCYRAKRFLSGSHVLDLCCGIGGDTIGLAQRCYVTAVERDAVRLEMARRNVEVYGLSDRVRFLCADVTEISLEADAAFVDPSRRVGGKRVRKLSQIEPSIDFLHRLVLQVKDVGIKLSPVFSDSELESFCGEIEFISEKRECKEAVIWLGRFMSAERRATVLPEEATIMSRNAEASVGRLAEFLYEPDPSVIRAHLVGELAEEIGAWKLDAQIAYLASSNLVKTPFADAYHVERDLPFGLRRVKAALAALGAGEVVVKKRGVPYDIREIQRQLKRPGEKKYVLVITRVSGQPWAIVCTPVYL